MEDELVENLTIILVYWKVWHKQMKFEKFELLALMSALNNLIAHNGEDWYSYYENENGNYVNLIELEQKLKQEFQNIC